MAAPGGIVWGDIKGGYCRIGIYVALSHTDTQTTASVQVWFWSKYSVSDSSNRLYVSNTATSTASWTDKGSFSLNTTHDSGDGWSTDNQVRLGTFSYIYNRGTSAVRRYLNAQFSSVDKAGGIMYASTTFTVPALPTYTITYNANGGSGAPSKQNKKYNTELTLSTTKPTRTGYTFQGWATSASGSVAYASGASYTNNDSAILYAVWKANTYTVSYDANGGSGAPGKQTKTYGTALTLSSTKPTRANYTFLGWGTSASSTTVSYAAGASYTKDAAITLYAVWKLAYVAPIIYNLTVARCDSSGLESDSGTYALVKFDWKTTNSAPSITVAWESASAAPGSKATTATGTSGTYSAVVGGSLSADATYKITVTVDDSSDTTSASTTLNGSTFPIDYLPGGRGIGFGKPAELAGVADFGLAAKFNEPVYGNVMGLNKLPEIPVNSDFDSYMTTGAWAVYKNDNAKTNANMPVQAAGRLEVSSATGEGIRSQQWSYLRQRFIPYNSSYPTWERDIARDSSNAWTYYDWWRSTLTPEASARVYKTPTVLWTGAWFMKADHTAPLSEAISEQNNGVVLVFSQYADSAAQNRWWCSFFVPKDLVISRPGNGHCFVMVGPSNQPFEKVCVKYLYLFDDRIEGHTNNNTTGTASGITYANDSFVLRNVIGV